MAYLMAANAALRSTPRRTLVARALSRRLHGMGVVRPGGMLKQPTCDVTGDCGGGVLPIDGGGGNPTAPTGGPVMPPGVPTVCEYADPACGPGSYATFVPPPPGVKCGSYVCSPNAPQLPTACPSGQQRDINGICVNLPNPTPVSGTGKIWDSNSGQYITLAQLASLYATFPTLYASLYNQYVGGAEGPATSGMCPPGQSLAPNGQCAFSCPIGYELNAALQCIPLNSGGILPTTPTATTGQIYDPNSGQYITLAQLASLYAQFPQLYTTLYNQYIAQTGFAGGMNVNNFTYQDPITGQNLNFSQLSQLAAQYPQYYGAVYQQALASLGMNAGVLPGTQISATSAYGYTGPAASSGPSAFSWFSQSSLISGMPNGVALGLGVVGAVVLSKVLGKALK